MRLSRALTAVLCCASTACASWQQRSPSQLDGMHPVRVELASRERIEFDAARLRGDTIVGTAGRPAQETAVPLTSVRRVEVHQFSAARTAGLVVGTAVGVFVGGIALILSAMASHD